MKALSVSLVMSEKIQTTLPKAKELRPYTEKLITTAKKKTVASQRDLVTALGTVAAKKLANDIAPRYKDRKGGYTRIVKTGRRAVDASPRAIIEFV
jgi:large subunit ribosomal protein L17